uniref:pentatricopeptide repeat-containing protein At4g04790, mitochondrial-like n=1 Tax=Erigeron canadensis TaxID=72917 RepID=UPI001CB96C7A|nr:pentatricopeptide repeat-containing protein At4g04790, mitochondrial-like [Erigeron canadensis]
MSSSMALFSSTPATKSILVSELAIKGHMSDALVIYDEMGKIWSRKLFYFLFSTYDLLKQRVQKATRDFHINSIFVGAFVEITNTEPAGIQFGIDLFRAIKEDLRIRPPRGCPDFLLASSVAAKEGAGLVWKEYELAGLPYNQLTYLSMHQALLASGQHEQAELLLENMPRSFLDEFMEPLIMANNSTFGCVET